MSKTTDDEDIDLYRIYSMPLITNLARIFHVHWRAMFLPSMLYVVRWISLIVVVTAIPMTTMGRTGNIGIAVVTIFGAAVLSVKSRREARRLLGKPIRNGQFRTYAVERGFLRFVSAKGDRAPTTQEQLGDILLLPGLILMGLVIGILANVVG